MDHQVTVEASKDNLQQQSITVQNYSYVIDSFSIFEYTHPFKIQMYNITSLMFESYLFVTCVSH